MDALPWHGKLDIRRDTVMGEPGFYQMFNDKTDGYIQVVLKLRRQSDHMFETSQPIAIVTGWLGQRSRMAKLATAQSI